MNPEFPHLEGNEPSVMITPTKGEKVTYPAYTIKLTCECGGSLILLRTDMMGEYIKSPDSTCQCETARVKMITDNPKRLGVISSET